MSTPLPDAEDATKRARRLLRAYQWLEKVPEGRIVIEDLLRESGLLSVAHVPGDPYATHFNDGRRSIGLHLLDRLRWTEGELVQLARRRTATEIEEA